MESISLRNILLLIFDHFWSTTKSISFHSKKIRKQRKFSPRSILSLCIFLLFYIDIIYWRVNKSRASQGGSVVKNWPTNAGDAGDMGLIAGLGRFPWRRAWQPTRVLAWKISWTEEPVPSSCNPWGHKEPDGTEHTHK